MYAVVERDGGRVVAAEVIGFAALQHRLWLIARDRRLSIEPQPSRSCPTCGAPLIANFRWCQSCGTDFEPWRAEPTPMAKTATAQALSGAPTSTATLATPAATMTRPTPVTGTPPPRSMAPGVSVFRLDPTSAATASVAAPARPDGDASPGEIRIVSDRLPPAPRYVGRPPAPRGIRARLSDALEASPFDGPLILLGVVVGLSIGVLVTIVLLAIE